MILRRFRYVAALKTLVSGLCRVQFELSMVRIRGAMTSGAEVGQFKPRKESLDAQGATLMLPRDRIGHNDDSHPVISRDQSETMRFTLCIVQNRRS